MNRSTLIFSPREQNLGRVDTAARWVIGYEALLLVVAGVVPTAQTVFIFSLIGFHAVMTAMVRFDPVYWLMQISSVPVPVARVKRYSWRKFLAAPGRVRRRAVGSYAAVPLGS